MTLRERIADWITGGALTFHKNGWARSSALYDEANGRAEQFQEAAGQAYVWHEQLTDECEELRGKLALIELDNRNGWQNCKLLSDAMRTILTARNITEARKIAREALGDET